MRLDIYYPNNNTTTDLCYAQGYDYLHTVNNTLNISDATHIILKNQIVCADVVTNPTLILTDGNNLNVLFWTLIIGIIIIYIIYMVMKAIK